MWYLTKSYMHLVLKGPNPKEHPELFYRYYHPLRNPPISPMSPIRSSVAEKTKSPFALPFRKLFVRRGGGRKIWARKIIYRKIFPYQNHMLTMFEAKRGRWVYEGGELEQDSKNPMGCCSVFRHYYYGL
jgi:hypothetical protein